MKTPSTELVQVPFYGDTLDAAKIDDGRIMVSVKRVCEALGIASQGQLSKLRECPWATVTMIVSIAEDGKHRRISMIDLESLPMWLVTIHPSKVAFETRAKLEVYQKEAKAVLAAWFLGKSTARPDLAREFEGVKARLSEIEAKFDKSEKLRATTLETAVHYRNKSAAMLRPVRQEKPYAEYMTFREFCDTYKVGSLIGYRLSAVTLRSISRFLRKFSESNGVEVRRAFHPLFGHVNEYRIDILQGWFAATELFASMSIVDFVKTVQGRIVL